MTTLTQEEMATDGQVKQISRTASDAAEKAVKEYFKGTATSKRGAQRVHGNADFAVRIREAVILALADMSVTDKFKNEEVGSSYTYPSGYSVKPISMQVDILAKIFSLSLGNTSEFLHNVLAKHEITTGAEGRFAIASIDAVAARSFPEVTDPAERYCRVIQLGVQKLKESRSMYSWFEEGQIVPSRFRRLPRTLEVLERIKAEQTGDILVIDAQLGMRHRGRSVRRAREVFRTDEYGLGAWEVINIALTHPERFVRSDELDIDCAGDEFDPGSGDGFSYAPCLCFLDGGVEFYDGWFGGPYGLFGAASGFVPQM